jgi:hypothetical protein
MKYAILISGYLIFCACSASKPKESTHEAVLTKLDSINSWYYRLVVKQYRPVYVFQTEVYNKDNVEIHGNIYEYFLVEKDKTQTEFDSDFVNRNFDFAESYLKEKSLRYSKIYLQIPYKNDGFTHDILSMAAKEQAVVNELAKREFFFDNSIASLVDSKMYNPNFTISELPKDLIRFIKNRFEKVKTFLPDVYRVKVSKSKLIIAEPSTDFDASKLFLQNYDGDVKISSLLIRAILVKAISQEAFHVLDYAGSNFKLNSPVQILQIPQLERRARYEIDEINAMLFPQQTSWISTRERFAYIKKPEIEYAYNDIIATINSTLDFLFLHEFSHIYLGPNMIDEFRADCYAYSPLKMKNSQMNYGVFSELMVTAIENKGGHYWLTRKDSLKLQQIVDRYSRIKKIDSLVDEGKMIKDVQCDRLNF